jgi:hypothetical protein
MSLVPSLNIMIQPARSHCSQFLEKPSWSDQQFSVFPGNLMLCLVLKVHEYMFCVM